MYDCTRLSPRPSSSHAFFSAVEISPIIPRTSLKSPIIFPINSSPEPLFQTSAILFPILENSDFTAFLACSAFAINSAELSSHATFIGIKRLLNFSTSDSIAVSTEVSSTVGLIVGVYEELLDIPSFSSSSPELMILILSNAASEPSCAF